MNHLKKDNFVASRATAFSKLFHKRSIWGEGFPLGWDWFLNLVVFFLTSKIKTIPTELFCLCRLPYHDGRLVLRVCLWGCGGQEVPVPRCSGRYATGTHCAACLGPNGIVGVVLEPSRPPRERPRPLSRPRLQEHYSISSQVSPCSSRWNQ